MRLRPEMCNQVQRSLCLITNEVFHEPLGLVDISTMQRHLVHRSCPVNSFWSSPHLCSAGCDSIYLCHACCCLIREVLHCISAVVNSSSICIQETHMYAYTGCSSEVARWVQVKKDVHCNDDNGDMHHCHNIRHMIDTDSVISCTLNFAQCFSGNATRPQIHSILLLSKTSLKTIFAVDDEQFVNKCC